jgi:glycerophosphoryl diester phosphodiesterase
LIYRLDAGSWFAPQYAGEKVPGLAETMDCLARCGLGANLELKPVNGNYAKLAALVERFIMTSWPANLPEPVISSYCEETLHAMYRINPHRRLGLLYEQHDWLDWARRLNVFAIHKVAKTFSRADIQHYRELGYPVIVGIVNDAQQARQLFDWGVAGIFSDYPDRVMVK